MDDTYGIPEPIEAEAIQAAIAAHEIEGVCDICGTWIKKGEPFTRDPEFADSMFCADPECGEIASEPSVRDVARRLASGGAS